MKLATKWAMIDLKIIVWGSKLYRWARAYKTCPSKGNASSHEKNNENTTMGNLRSSIFIFKKRLPLSEPTKDNIPS
ncbi:hypothetical protein [Desulfosporosinus sp. I2]|uniref:hypothetical protein n=1 Tax=Desulfosporosinus sp. I2 TaxID=1617025 RepID=UPI001A9A32C0|nr:hypothetical protein [Desulfosporosinus sp. I2]